MSREEQLNPEPCPDCGAPQHVALYGKREHDEIKHYWGLECWACGEMIDVMRDPATGPALVYVVAERRILGPREVARRARGREASESIVWVQPGESLCATTLDRCLQTLRSLDMDRATRMRKPGAKWELELVDGVPWAPWCPVGWGSLHRHGDRLPYRETTLRKAKGERRCIVCKTPLEAGQRAWRPHNPGSSITRAGWSSDASRDALVCPACVAKLRVKVAPQPVEAGPLAVVEGRE